MMIEPKPVWITDSTSPAALSEVGHSTVIVSKKIAAVLTRLQQLANVCAFGAAPAVARVDLRTWTVTLETSAAEQERDAEEIDDELGALAPSL